MIFGEYNYINVDVDKLVTLPQVRKIKNAKIEELVDSIRSNGLINPIDIVILDKESFINHINFINIQKPKSTKNHSMLCTQYRDYICSAF